VLKVAHAVLELQNHGKPVHRVNNISFNTLCDNYGAFMNPLKEQVNAVYRKDPRFWARRPLTTDMICYAAADVISLVHIYKGMQM
jgi:exonuclease 3'-5' domain-containing protein 1